MSYCGPLVSALGLVLLFSLVAIAPVQGEQQDGLEVFPDLVGGLQAIEGVLGVETAQTVSGKQVIFAWFESKEAVLRWYAWMLNDRNEPGDRDKARTLLGEAIEMYRTIGMPKHVEMAERMSGAL